MTVEGVEPTPSSSLKQLKAACKFLGLAVTGSKAVIWHGLKTDAATSKLKKTVEISKSILVRVSERTESSEFAEATVRRKTEA